MNVVFRLVKLFSGLRVDAVLRRIDTAPDSEPPLRFDELVVDPGGRRVLIDDVEVALTQAGAARAGRDR